MSNLKCTRCGALSRLDIYARHPSRMSRLAAVLFRASKVVLEFTGCIMMTGWLYAASSLSFRDYAYEMSIAPIMPPMPPA